MNPDQAEWQGGEGETSTTLTLYCTPDSFRIESGSFKYEGGSPNDASDTIKSLVQHGQEQAQQQ